MRMAVLHRVARVIHGCPGVGPGGQAAVCQQEQNLDKEGGGEGEAGGVYLLVGVVLAALKDEVLEGVGQPVVIMSLRGQAEVTGQGGVRRWTGKCN